MYPLQWATYGQAEVETDAFNNALKDIKEILRHINSYLVADGGKNYLVGNRLTVADIYVALPLVQLFQTTLDNGFRKAIPNVNSWIEAFLKVPEVVARLGNVKLC